MKKIARNFDLEIEKNLLEKELKKNTRWFDPILYNVGIYLMTPILLGVFIGYNLDRYFGSKPIFFLIFLTFGLFSAGYNFWKLVK